MPSLVERRRVLHRLSRRQTLWLSALVGLAAGVLATFFRVAVAQIEAGREWLHLHCEPSGAGGWWLLAAAGAALGWTAGRLTERLCPEAGGSGIPLVKGYLLSLRPLRPLRTFVVKLGAGMLALMAGLSLGREGPTIHIGASVAALFPRLGHIPPRSLKSLVSAGAGAGLAAAFNAPLAGFLFIMEELRRDLSHYTYGSALISTVSAVAVARLCLGQDSNFGLPDVPPMALSSLPVLCILGGVATLIGVAFNRSLLGCSAWRERSGWSRAEAGAVVGGLGGCMIAAYPELTGGGHGLTHEILHGRWLHEAGLAILAALLLGKFVLTVAAYATGVPGGFFAPLLTLGALTGYLTGLALQSWMPGWTPAPEIMATVGMAAVLSASVRAPLTGVVLIVEMTGQYHLLYGLLVASFVAYALAEMCGGEPIYEALLQRDLRRVSVSESDDTQTLEILIEPTSRMEHQRIEQLRLHPELLIALVQRGSRSLIPHGSTRLEAGDILVLVRGPELPEAELTRLLEQATLP